jgi:hypothetical protein
LLLLAAALRAAVPAAGDDREALAALWSGMYDVTEELVIGAADDSPLASLSEQERVQIDVRRVSLPWLGTHVLYVEEYPYDEPFEPRRRVLLDIQAPDANGTLRVRQYTRKAGTSGATTLTAQQVETDPGCDLLLKREGSQFRGGTLARTCLQREAREPRWLDYRVVIGDGLFWYRKRALGLAHNDLLEEIAGFPHVAPEEARLFSCGISWSAPREKGRAERRAIDSVDLHDRGGRARFHTPDGRELTLELHGRDWPLSAGRESLVLILRGASAASDTIASSWTSLDAARVGIDIGWLAVDCAPVVSETGEQHS